MEIKVKSVALDPRSIVPALNIIVEAELFRDMEALLSITGRLSTQDGKTIAYLNEFRVDTKSKIDLKMINDKERNAIHNSAHRYQYYRPQLTAVLSPTAIDYIEKIREKEHEKAVNFQFDFAVKFQTIPLTPEHLALSQFHNVPLVSLTTKNFNTGFTIKQSDWVTHYSPGLGIGNFILLEFGLPGKEKVIDEWAELYDRLYFRAQEMQQSIREGDWQKTMNSGRQFYENIKIGDGKPKHKKLVESLKTRFLTDQYSDEAFTHLLESFYHLFQFTTKYVHDKDQQAELRPLPIAYRSDAYLVFTIAVGLLKLIGRKIREAD